MAALLQMQLQAMERVEEQGTELRRLSNLMTEHQDILRSSPERPQPQSSPASPSHNLAQLRGEVEDVLPGMVKTVRGAAERSGQIPGLGNLPIHIRGYPGQTRGGGPHHSPKAGQICNINSSNKTCGATQGEDSLL